MLTLGVDAETAGIAAAGTDAAVLEAAVTDSLLTTGDDNEGNPAGPPTAIRMSEVFGRPNEAISRFVDSDVCAYAECAAKTAYIALAISVSRIMRVVRRGSRRRAPFIFIPSLLDKRTVQALWRISAPRMKRDIKHRYFDAQSLY